jgi:hypothetical protein
LLSRNAIVARLARFGEATPPSLGEGSSPALGVLAIVFTRTRQSGAAIDNCRFAWRVPDGRLLEAWVQEPEQARGRFDGDRCFARRSDAVAQRAVTPPGRVDC